MFVFISFLMTMVKSSPENDAQCQQYFDTAMSDIAKGGFPSNVTPQTLLFSGKGLQDLGSYLVCRDQADYRYIHLRMMTPTNPMHLGMCLPSYCEMDYLQNYNEPTKESINKITEQTYNQSMITSAQYQDPDLMYPQWSFSHIFALILLTTVIILNFVGSGVTLFIESQKEKHQKSILAQQKQPIYSPSTILQNEVVENQEQMFMSGAKQVNDDHYLKEFKPPTWTKYFICFSFVANFRKLFKIEKPTGDNQSFVIFNGIRALSIFWVIYGHDQLIRAKNAYNLVDVTYKIQEAGWVTLIPSAYFAVDVFFFVGGFLAAVLVLEKLLKMKFIKWILVPSMWVHRFLRIWPTYAFCLIVYWQLSIYWSDGPVWNEYIVMADYCQGTWWRNLMFIDNMFSHAQGGLEYCYGWGWYLSNDFQIFLVTPILLIIYAKNRKLGLGILIGIFVGSVVWAYVLSMVKDYHLMLGAPNAKPQPDYQDVFYYKPWIRIAPYIMGILFGLLYRKLQSGDSQRLNDIAYKIKTSTLIRALMYFVGIALTQTMVWIIVPLQSDMGAWPKQCQYLYQAFNRVIFVAGVAICLTPALLGIKNDPARRILGHPIWVPIARISFSMYLVHFAVILFMTLSSTQMVYYQSSHVIFFVITDIIYTLFLAGIVSLAVEVPCMNLEKIFFAPRPNAKKHQITANEE